MVLVPATCSINQVLPCPTWSDIDSISKKKGALPVIATRVHFTPILALASCKQKTTTSPNDQCFKDQVVTTHNWATS